MAQPIQPLLHWSIFDHSMYHFCQAQMYPQTHMEPEPGFGLAAMTKHASFTPSDVANMPDPQGHQKSVSWYSP